MRCDRFGRPRPTLLEMDPDGFVSSEHVTQVLRRAAVRRRTSWWDSPAGDLVGGFLLVLVGLALLWVVGVAAAGDTPSLGVGPGSVETYQVGR